jgi:hypothetical protein
MNYNGDSFTACCSDAQVCKEYGCQKSACGDYLTDCPVNEEDGHILNYCYEPDDKCCKLVVKNQQIKLIVNQMMSQSSKYNVSHYLVILFGNEEILYIINT